ncbi:phage tail protein [Pseudomonas chlororaphis]|uniref:phage tail-collar fiber domain-containing protein n=1 Tax=Pseudomonas chlororaphis TaxID=587753 RepID=UPI00209B7847|nr:phage tail protein [Pseudomonas chlororaphis]MCO7608631.1 phage tail protein [Pseudomonas chlororaphis]
MIDSNSQFFAILTAVGEAKQANATALGTPWTFKEMAVGDANGSDPIPNRAQTKLINEWRRAPVNQVRTDPANPNIIITEQVIPPDVGGRWIREIGLFDADGDLVAVANCAPSFKPLLAQGTGKTQVIRMNFIVANTAQIVLKIDPAVVLATREYVDSAVIEALAKLDFKHSALVATTANIALSGIQTIDGVLLPADARVLVKNQAQAKDNGLYVVSSTGVWTRAQDADTSLEVTPGLFVSIEKGTVNGDSVWQLVTDGPIVLGTTPLAFEMAIGRTGISAGSYANVTVDKYGRVIAGTNPSTLAGHGITDTYTKAEIESIVAQSSSLPVGSMVAFPRASVPPGFLEIDGSVQSVAAYPDLAAYLGTTFNKGDEGAGNFRLPESRGEFLRGWDHGRGVDAGRVIGSRQDASIVSAGDAVVSGVSVVAFYNDLNDDSAAFRARLNSDGTPTALPNVQYVGTGANISGPGIASAMYVRPRNLAVMWCIKAWNAPINQGNIDVAALVKELAALKSAHPVGAIIPFPKAEVPAGYLELNGSVHSIAAYPDLAAYLGTTFNKGDEGAGNFRLPESRGEFLRGWDHGRGVDAGRALGTYQASMSNTLSKIRMEGGYDIATNIDMSIPDDGTWSKKLAYDWVGHGLKLANSGSETRPRNLAVMWCIKAWNAPVNQGNIDIAVLAAQVQELSAKGAIVGSIRNGKMLVGVPSASATYVADELVLVNALGGQSYRLASFNKTINLATVGVGGMDVGAAPANGFVAIYAIYNPTTGVSGLLATNATAAKVGEVYGGANMPAGYSATCLLTVVPTNAASQIPMLTVRDRQIRISSVYVYTTTALVNTLVAASVVPSNAVTISGTIEAGCTAASQVGILISDGDVPGAGMQSIIDNVPAGGNSVASYKGIALTGSKQFAVTTSIAGSGTATYKVAVSEYCI